MQNFLSSRTTKSGVSHWTEYIPKLVLSFSTLQPRMRNTWTPSSHSTPRSIRFIISHYFCCAQESWVHGSNLHTRPGISSHSSPHARTHIKSPRLDNINRHWQGLQAKTPRPSSRSVLSHTQEKIHGVCRSNMSYYAHSPPQQIRKTHKPRHWWHQQADEEPNQHRNRIRSLRAKNRGQKRSRGASKLIPWHPNCDHLRILDREHRFLQDGLPWMEQNR